MKKAMAELSLPGHQRLGPEASIFWPPDAKSQLIGKDPDAGKDCRQEEKGAAEDKMVGWHHWFNEHEFGLHCISVVD